MDYENIKRYIIKPKPISVAFVVVWVIALVMVGVNNVPWWFSLVGVLCTGHLWATIIIEKAVLQN